jgi:1-deoxy-D-xylulose-5-phosphate synthase
MSILEGINSPADLRGLSRDELRTLAQDMRSRLIDVCSRTGGHIGAGLGVVELTIALHTVFETPKDQLVWDVGHQAYPHKLLTGRNSEMESLRQESGLSGFLKRTESEYDTFGAGHAATAISAALGMAAGRDVLGEQFKVAAIIGDGSMGSGLAYEGFGSRHHCRVERQRDVDRPERRRDAQVSHQHSAQSAVQPFAFTHRGTRG